MKWLNEPYQEEYHEGQTLNITKGHGRKTSIQAEAPRKERRRKWDFG